VIFRRVLPKGERENPWRTGGLASTQVNRLVGQTDMQRDCGVSWLYQAFYLPISKQAPNTGYKRNGDFTLLI